MNKEQYDFFSRDIGVKQGCPFSPTLFGLCIGQLEDLAQQFTQIEGINTPTIGQIVILLLIYADNVALLYITKSNDNKIMQVLDNLGQLSDL